MSKVSELTTMLEPAINALDCELWGIEHIGQGRHSTLRLYIEREEGVGIEHCEQVSRQVSAILDVEDPISGEYTLEVSSPGLDRPLFTLEQCEHYVGELVEVRLRVPLEKRRKFSGLLAEVQEQNIVVVVDGENYSLPFNNVEKAKIQLA